MRYFLILLFAFLAGCGSSIPTVKPFKMDIQQGNVVTSKMLLQLRPGMTKSQVKFIMGSPLIVDSFHKDRWDYFYQMRRAGKIVEQRRVILDFDKELLTKVRGDVVPEDTAGAATGNESAVAKTIIVEPKPKQEKSWADKLKFWKKDDPAKEADRPTAIPEKMDAPVKSDSLEANKQAPAGDAPTNSVGTPADEAAITEPSADTPSVLAVPIGGVLAPDVSAVEAPAVEVPAVVMPNADVPTIEAPAMEAPVIIAPLVEAPKSEAPAKTLKPVAALKPTEEPKVEAPKVELTVAAPIEVPAPAGKADERLIFRMDKKLDLKNLQAPDEQTPAPKVENNALPAAAKSKKIEPPLPEVEAPGYFERMLEKIGF